MRILPGSSGGPANKIFTLSSDISFQVYTMDLGVDTYQITYYMQQSNSDGSLLSTHLYGFNVVAGQDFDLHLSFLVNDADPRYALWSIENKSSLNSPSIQCNVFFRKLCLIL